MSRETDLEFYYRRLRQVQADYERALSEPRAWLIQAANLCPRGYILHPDGMIEYQPITNPDHLSVIEQAREVAQQIHESFREPMRKAAEDYGRARDGHAVEPQQDALREQARGGE